MFHRHTELECMERAMYFEANRSSRDGLIAVGSVVMNRVQSNQFPNSVCGVVGQKGQFAPGIMTRRMDKAPPQVREAARAVLRGERHPLIGNAMFFHTAGHRFSYDNMHYVLVAGGNAFYEKRKNYLVTQPVPPRPIEGITGR
ncbi:cell wall hydrolase [Paracoccus sp. PXZ]